MTESRDKPKKYAKEDHIFPAYLGLHLTFALLGFSCWKQGIFKICINPLPFLEKTCWRLLIWQLTSRIKHSATACSQQHSFPTPYSIISTIQHWSIVTPCWIVSRVHQVRRRQSWVCVQCVLRDQWLLCCIKQQINLQFSCWNVIRADIFLCRHHASSARSKSTLSNLLITAGCTCTNSIPYVCLWVSWMDVQRTYTWFKVGWELVNQPIGCARFSSSLVNLDLVVAELHHRATTWHLLKPRAANTAK